LPTEVPSPPPVPVMLMSPPLVAMEEKAGLYP
jgi:hypothetical protein